MANHDKDSIQTSFKF